MPQGVWRSVALDTVLNISIPTSVERAKGDNILYEVAHGEHNVQPLICVFPLGIFPHLACAMDQRRAHAGILPFPYHAPETQVFNNMDLEKDFERTQGV